MENNGEMFVTKRDGKTEIMSFDKILVRVKKLGQEVNIKLNYSSLAMKVIDQLYDKISTTKIDELAAEQCASLSTENPDYGILSGRIVISNYQKNTDQCFFNVMQSLYEFRDIHNVNKPLISENFWNFVKTYQTEIEEMLNHERDYLIDYFGFKTLERAYLFKLNDKSVE